MASVRLFDALYRKQNVSVAARELDIPQSSASRGLAKLRDIFSDELFVRGSGAMQPTPTADRIAPELLRVLEASHNLRRIGEDDVVNLEGRIFRIAASDAGQLIAIKTLLDELPPDMELRLEAVQITGTDLSRHISDGTVDFALGNYPSLAPSIKAIRLYSESYACFAPPDSAFVTSPTRKTYLAADHCLVSTKGLAHVHRKAERQLRSTLDPSRIRAATTSFVAGLALAKYCALIVTAPAKALQDVAIDFGLEMIASPIDLPNFDVKLYWHERFDRDPTHRWLRSRMSLRTGRYKSDPPATP